VSTRNAIGFLHKKHKPQQKQRLEICKGEEHVSESTVCSTAKGATYLAPLYGLFFGLGSICPFYIPRIELRFDGALPAQYIHPMGVALCIWAAAKSAAFTVGAVSRGSWRHTSANDAMRIVLANSAGSILGGLVILLLVGPWGIPRSMYILDWLIACSLTLGGRLAVRVVLTAKGWNRVKGERTRTLIYGAGTAGRALLWELRQNHTLMCDVIGIVDDDPSKVGFVLDGKRVMGTGKASKHWCRSTPSRECSLRFPPQQDRKWCAF